jgi:hypothetical protein
MTSQSHLAGSQLGRLWLTPTSLIGIIRLQFYASTYQLESIVQLLASPEMNLCFPNLSKGMARKVYLNVIPWNQRNRAICNSFAELQLCLPPVSTDDRFPRRHD